MAHTRNNDVPINTNRTHARQGETQCHEKQHTEGSRPPPTLHHNTDTKPRQGVVSKDKNAPLISRRSCGGSGTATVRFDAVSPSATRHEHDPLLHNNQTGKSMSPLNSDLPRPTSEIAAVKLHNRVCMVPTATTANTPHIAHTYTHTSTRPYSHRHNRRHQQRRMGTHQRYHLHYPFEGC